MLPMWSFCLLLNTDTAALFLLASGVMKRHCSQWVHVYDVPHVSNGNSATVSMLSCLHSANTMLSWCQWVLSTLLSCRHVNCSGPTSKIRNVRGGVLPVFMYLQVIHSSACFGDKPVDKAMQACMHGCMLKRPSQAV